MSRSLFLRPSTRRSRRASGRVSRASPNRSGPATASSSTAGSSTVTRVTTARTSSRRTPSQADAAVANVSVVVQSSEQAQAIGGDGVQTSAQFASVAQAGLASTFASQLESVNTAHLGQAGDTTVVSAQSAPVVPSTIIVTQVSQTAADASVGERERDRPALGAAPGRQPQRRERCCQCRSRAGGDRHGRRDSRPSTSNRSSSPANSSRPGPVPSSAPADLEIVQANLASAVSTSANTSFVSQESIQSQVGAETSSADSAQVAIVSQQAETHSAADQTAGRKRCR